MTAVGHITSRLPSLIPLRRRDVAPEAFSICGSASAGFSVSLFLVVRPFLKLILHSPASVFLATQVSCAYVASFSTPWLGRQDHVITAAEGWPSLSLHGAGVESCASDSNALSEERGILDLPSSS